MPGSDFIIVAHPLSRVCGVACRPQVGSDYCVPFAFRRFRVYQIVTLLGLTCRSCENARGSSQHSGLVMGTRTRRLSGALAAAVLSVVISSARAATIEPGQGNLSVNQGQGFRPVNNRIDANVGDAVMVSPGGSATIVYGDGCKVTAQPGAVLTITELSPCASGSFAQDNNNNFNWTTGAFLLGVAGVSAFDIVQGTSGSSPSFSSSPTSP
jgi:hypothetical protein